MNNILAAKVLMSHLPEITDGAYKTATEIAIKSLLLDAMEDWHKSDTGLTAIEYLGITEEQYNRWIIGHGLQPTMMYQEKKVKSTDEMWDDIQELKRSGKDMLWFRINEDMQIVVEIVAYEDGDTLKIILTLKDTDSGKTIDMFICDYDDGVEVKSALGHLKGYVLG